MDAAEDQHSVKGCYVLVVVSEPVSEDHKQLILQRLNKGFLSWDVEETGCDLTGLASVCENVKNNKDAQESDVLIQYSTESLGVEVLVNPPVSTLKQCMKNLLASSIGHKHLIHSGYTFAGSGSWILQNGTFSFGDFLNAFQDAEVQKHKGCTIHVHGIEEGEWSDKNLKKEAFSKVAKVSLNPSDCIDRLPGAEHLLDCLSNVLNSHSLDEIMEPSPLVGNVRFNSPTLYLFPAGDGDCSLFGVNGFNMLVDGGFSRKPCSWEFIRHLDRVDAVLVTRLNENNLCGLSTLMKRKSINNSSPEVGYVFCNIAEDGAPSPVSSEELQKDKNDLLVSIVGEGHKFVHTLNELNLKPHQCWRAGTAEPCVLYHKVGQGTLEMYILSPPKGSKEVQDFLQEWNSYKEKFSKVKSGLKHKNLDVSIPLSHATSICALVVWRPADPKESITRILLPGSAPQSKIFESLELLKNLDILKQPTVTRVSLSNIIVAKPKPKLEKPQVKTSVPSRKNTASPSLSVSSVASRNGDIGAPKKEIIKKENKEVKKDNKEIKKEIKKDNKEIKAATEKKFVAKAAPKKTESSPPAPKPTEAKRPALVKKSTMTAKKDSTKPVSTPKSTEKSEAKKSTTPKISESKIAKEMTNKKVAETKTTTKTKPKTTASAGKVAAKSDKSKPAPVTKISKTAKTTAAAAAATAAVAITAAAAATAAIGATVTEEVKKEEIQEVAVEVPVLAEKVESVEDIAKEDESHEEQKIAQISVLPTPPEAISPAPSETASLTPSDTLSSAPMETVSPTPPLPDAGSPGEEKEVNEVKEVDNEISSTDQEEDKFEASNLDHDVDAEQEHTLIDHSTEDTPVQMVETDINVEKETDDTLDTEDKENEIAAELPVATDMTLSFIGNQESVDLMTSSFIKQNDDMGFSAVEETIEQSLAVVTESAPSEIREDEIDSQEEFVVEHDSENKYELQDQLDEQLLEHAIANGDELLDEGEIIKTSDHEEFIKESENEPEPEFTKASEHVAEKQVMREEEKGMLLESQNEEVIHSDEKHMDEISDEKDIDSFLAGATMEGSICAGIPIHDERDFNQDESDFNANNQLEDEDKDQEQIQLTDSDIIDAAPEMYAYETHSIEGTAAEINEKFDSESATAFQSETAVDEISADLPREHLQEKNINNESETHFIEKDTDDSDEKFTDEQNYDSMYEKLEDEKHADSQNEKPFQESTKEAVEPLEEMYLGKQEIESDIMSTSLIGETEFGIEKQTSEDDREVQTPQESLNEGKDEEDVDRLVQEEFVKDEEKFATYAENSQISHFDEEAGSGITEKVSDKYELIENVEEAIRSETHFGATEITPETQYPETEELGNDHKEDVTEIKCSQPVLHEQETGEHPFASEENPPSEITEAEINSTDLKGDEDVQSSVITTEQDTTTHIADEITREAEELHDNIVNKENESKLDEIEDHDIPDEVVRKESAVSIVLECEQSDEKRRESYAESEDDVDINRYMVKDETNVMDLGRLNVRIPSRDSDSDDEDVVKSPTPHAIVDYAGQLDDHIPNSSHETVETCGLEENFDTDNLKCDSDNVENYASESKQNFNEKDRDSAEDDEEMIRHPTPPGEQRFYENMGPSEGQDIYDEMRDPISQHFVSSPSFRQTSDVIDDPLYEEPEGSDSERSNSPVIEQPVFGNVGEADFPELVNVSGGTTPSEPQSPKFSQDSKNRNNALGVEVMEALSEHDVDCSETSLHSPLCKDEQNIFEMADNIHAGAAEAPDKEKCSAQQDLVGSLEEIKEQVNVNDPDIANEMTTSGYTLDDISSSVLSTETQCSTVVTSESFSSSVITSEFTGNMQSSMYEQFNDDADPVLGEIGVADEKHEQESSKEIVEVKHPSDMEPLDHPDVESFKQAEDHHDSFPVADQNDILATTHTTYQNEKEDIYNTDGYGDDHPDAEDKHTNSQFFIKENQQLATSYEHSEFIHDDHRIVEAKDINLQFSSNENHQLTSNSTHSELHHRDEKVNNLHGDEDKFTLSGSSQPNGHGAEQMLTSEHTDINDDCPLSQVEVKSFGVNDIQSNHWQDAANDDSNNPINCSSQFSEISQSNVKVEQEYKYTENSRFHSASPEDNIMENDSSPEVPSPAEPEIPFTHISDQKISVPADPQNNFDGNENNFSHDITAQDGFSSDNMNFPCGVASISKYDSRREDPYGHSDSEDEDSSSIPGTVSPYAYTNKAYTQEEEEVDGNNIYKQSLRIEQTSEMKTLSFDGNNPQQLPDDITLSSSTAARMTYSPGFPDMSSADPNYDFRLEEWGKPMGLPTPPETGHNLVKKTAKGSALNKSLNKSNDKRSSLDNGKAGSPLIGTKALSSPSKAPLKSKAPAAASNSSPVYVDLAYVPHHGDPDYCDVEFFKKVRARYYVLSGINPSKEVLNALLEAKKSWKEDLEVTIIPTYETDTLGYWMAQNQETLTANSIEVAPSASRCTVNLQDHETRCSAYRLEF